MDGITIALSLEIAGITIALIAGYTKLIRTLENHHVRLKYIEQRLERIENKLDQLNGHERV